MGQLHFQTTKNQHEKKKLSLSRDPPKAIQSDGNQFTIVRECVLKMVTARRLELDANVKSENETNRKCIIAAFDLDQTLVKTKSGHIFARNGEDWVLLDFVAKHLKPNIAKLKEENPNQEVLVVIFTNQYGCLPKLENTPLRHLITRLSGVCGKLNIFDYCFAALKAGPEQRAKYRKPASGMFDELKANLEQRGVEINLTKSFYVGDAAGRPGDHSADDKGFAKSADLKFFTPEEYFTD